MDQVTSRPVACLHCRQRRSYCSKEKPSCSRCRDGGLACVYEGARKILVNESYLRELEAKAKALEAALSQPRAMTAGRSRNAAHDDEEDFEDEQPLLLEPFTQLSLEKPSTSFQGPASSDNFLRNVRKLSGLYGDDGSLDYNSNFYEPDALPSRRQVLRPHARLPPVDIARRLFAAQYMYIGTIFAFTDPRDDFERLLAEAYRGPPDPADKDACLEYAKVLLVLAFGQLYSVNQWVDFRGPPGFDYFTDSLNLLPETHEEGSMLCVETLALAGYFMQNMNRRDAAFQYIGKALRMAISLGLHQEVSPQYYHGCSSSPAAAHAVVGGRDDEVRLLDAAAREHRRRVWWSIYSLDRILCVKSGNPITIQDEDIGVELPSPLPGDPAYCPAVVLRHYTQLSRILGQIHTTIYRKAAPRSGRSLMASVQSVILSLSRWHRELPDDLRFEPARLSFSRESVGALAHYYQCINMTVRPLLFHVVQRRLRAGDEERRRDWKDGLSLGTVRVVDMCVGAAQDVVNMMAIASQRDMVATYGYMDGEHIFSATIVLVMVCAAFPHDAANTAAMNAGLGLLRSMGERGNSHMGARYELLANLRAGVMHSPPPPTPPPPYQTAIQPRLLDRDAATASATDGSGMANSNNNNNNNSHVPQRIPIPSAAGVDGPSNAVPFPVVDNSALDEPFYDESVASTGMDFGLWEEGFAYPTMDLDFDLAQRAAPGGAWMGQGGQLSEFMYSGGHAHTL